MRDSNFLYSVLGVPIVLLWICLANQATAQDRDVIVHDPVMIKEGDTYYIFHTGEGIAVKSSQDMISWKKEEPVFDSIPEWVSASIPDFGGSMWAPDIIYRDGIYYLYYSVSAFGRNTSAIGVATNDTLDPSDSAFNWEDKGLVVESVPGRDMWNAIDPHVIIDDNETPWMSFGSFWMGIKLVKMEDNMTEIVTGYDREWYTIAARDRDFKVDERDAGDAANPNLDYEALYSPEQLERNRSMQSGAIEAPFIFKKDDFYYLFVSWDRCCRGVNSSYKVLVGRSKDVRGPYIDKEGDKLIHGGGTLLVEGNDEWAAAGHQAVYTFDGKDYLVFHAYDRKDEGKPKLRIREITWNDKGWPEVTLGE